MSHNFDFARLLPTEFGKEEEVVCPWYVGDCAQDFCIKGVASLCLPVDELLKGIQHNLMKI